MQCKVAEINFELPQTKVEDWDDGMRVVTWKDTTRKLPGARWPIKERVRSKTAKKPAKKANPAFTKRDTVTPPLLAEQLLLPLDSREVHQQCILGERWMHSDQIHSHKGGKPFDKRLLATHKLSVCATSTSAAARVEWETVFYDSIPFYGVSNLFIRFGAFSPTRS